MYARTYYSDAFFFWQILSTEVKPENKENLAALLEVTALLESITEQNSTITYLGY